jgi:hypothetical protein
MDAEVGAREHWWVFDLPLTHDPLLRGSAAVAVAYTLVQALAFDGPITNGLLLVPFWFLSALFSAACLGAIVREFRRGARGDAR